MRLAGIWVLALAIGCDGSMAADAGPDAQAMDAGRDVDAGRDAGRPIDAHRIDAFAVDAPPSIDAGPAPTATVIFPPPRSLTDTDRIVVRGTASDPVGVAAVRVNGVEAITSDGFATWTAEVPLVYDENQIVVETEGMGGAVDPRAAVRTVRFTAGLLRDTYAIAIDEAGNRAFVPTSGNFEGAILSVDLATGERRVVSGQGVGSGPIFEGTVLGAVWDGSRLLVVSGGFIVEVDPTTGDRTRISGAGIGSGPALAVPYGLALNSVATTAYVAIIGDYSDTSDDGILAIDLATGDRTVVTDGSVGTGPSLDFPNGLARVDDATLLLAVNGSNSILSVDIATGDRTLITSGSRGTGPIIGYAWGIAVSEDLATAFVGGIDTGLFSVDLATGDRTRLIATAFGASPTPYRVNAIARHGDRIAIIDEGRGAIVGYTISTGESAFISESMLGAGDPLSTGPCLALRMPGAELAVGSWDGSQAAIVGIALADGARSLRSGGTRGSGPTMSLIGCAATADRVWATDYNATGLLDIDLASGDRVVASGGAIGGGPAFAIPAVIGLAPSGTSAIVVDTTLDALFSVDLASGDRSVVSADGDPSVTSAAQLVFVPGEDRVLIADSRAGIVSVDLGDGSRTALLPELSLQSRGITYAPDGRVWSLVHVGNNEYELWAIDFEAATYEVVSSAAHGNGPPMTTTSVLVYDPATALLYTGASEYYAIYAIDPITGERVIASR